MKTRTWIVLADAASARLYEAAGPRGNWALVAELAKALEDGLLKEAYDSSSSRRPPSSDCFGAS